MFSWFTGKKVEIQLNGRKFTSNTKKTILQSAVENNIPIKYNCGSGMCGQCIITLNSGEIRNNNNNN
ncbi:2Fe-2S iron-sulfur cluster binding domain-containing protein, partial [Vibrio kanaloae]